GNIYTGQIFNAIEKANANWLDELAKGNLEPIRTWLKNNIYCMGNLYNPAELIRKATGTELKVNPYIEYLQNKFKRIYNF
ncbi:MAG: carboxypeptidase M32, partial [Crenarchaeota archaeon]|nr:carboxypeptidase M32 [Thermoproteota archaeon]